MQGLVTSNIRTTCVALASLLSLLASTGGVLARTADAVDTTGTVDPSVVFGDGLGKRGRR